MAEEQNVLTYIMVGGEETYKNPLAQSPLAFRTVENLIPGIRGDFEQKLDPTSIRGAGTDVETMFNYERIEPDGSIKRFLMFYDDGELFKLDGADSAVTTVFPGSTGFAPLKQAPVFVQATNNLLYFTDGERWYVTDGTTVKLAGMDHPVDAPTFTTSSGTLDIVTNRFYWVAWADLSGEFFQWGSSSPISAGTGIVANKKFTITRPNHPPPRATHWILFASESEDDQTFGAHLATVPAGTATFEDQSPFLGDAGTAMVGTRRPIRNQIMVPGEWARLHKGRIFVGGFNKTPYVIRNPGFEKSQAPSSPIESLDGWTDSDGAQSASSAQTGVDPATFDQKGFGQIVRVTGSTGKQLGFTQKVDRVFKTGRKYRIECAGRIGAGAVGTVSMVLDLFSATDGQIGNDLVIVNQADASGSWFRNRSIEIDISKVPADLLMRVATITSANGDNITGQIDMIRVWELVPPSQIAYTALEEVEGLQNGRGEESMPGSTPAPEVNDNSDIVNLLNFPQESTRLVGAMPFNDTLVVFGDTSAVPLEGDSFDDFGFSEQITLSVGLAHKHAIAKSRHGLFFVSDGHKVFQAPLSSPVVESSRGIRGDVKDLDSSLPVWLEIFDFAERSWLSLSYIDTGGTRRLRLLDLETQQWFKFTDKAILPVVEFKPVAGKKVLLGAAGGTIHVLDDPQTNYTPSSNNVPVSKFRQVLLDLGDPSRFKVWKQFLIHTDATPTVAYWFDPFDPDNPGSSEALTMVAKTNLTQLLEGSFQVAGGAYGKRCLIEVTLPSVAGAKKVLGMEVYAEATTRRSL